MKSQNLFTIKVVSNHTGLKSHVIRAWESRYAAVVPERTATNRRLYCRKDLQRLYLLKMATEAGHQISRIAQASMNELRELLDLSASPMGDTLDVPPPDHGSVPSEENYQRDCLQSVVALNLDELNRSLCDASVHLTRQRWVEGIIVPLFKQIGDLWSSGRLKILNEHIASNCVRTIMADMLRSVEITSSAPRIVIGTPMGQWHELGALAAALASAEAGWRPIYVGTNLPSEELAAAVAHFDAKCIGLSLTHSSDDNRLQGELLNLRHLIGPRRQIIVGGHQKNGWENVIDQIGARRVKCWQDFLKTLRVLTMQ